MTNPFIIEICPHEPRASACTQDGAEIRTHELFQDWLDCNASGDAEEACKYVLSLGVDFRIVARTPSGGYENRLATESEISDTCRTIYFESESDFDDPDICRMYLVWEAASEFQGERA